MAARRENKNEVARIYLAHATARVAEFGNSAHAVESWDAALSLSPSRDVKMLTALTLAGAGSAKRTRSLEDERSKSNPGNPILNDWLPIIRRAAELDARHACSSAVGTCFCGRWWQGQGARGLSTLPHAVERGRPGHFHPHCCQVWVREAPLVPSRGRRFAPSVPRGNKRLTLFFLERHPRTNPCQWTMLYRGECQKRSLSLPLIVMQSGGNWWEPSQTLS